MPSYHDSDGSHTMNETEIEETIEGFVQAARRCSDAGFDGVEVWAAYHGMVDQFWTPWSNQRTDRWGGSMENRTRFSREIITRIRKICGDDFIVGIAVNDEPDFEVALQRESIAEIIALHDRDHLLDYVTCGTGSYFDFYKLMPTFLYPERLGAELAEVLKGAITHALVIAESHIRTPENAEAVFLPTRLIWFPSSAVKSRIRIWQTKPGKDEPKTFGPASHVIKCVGADAVVITGFPVSSIRLPAVNLNGVEIAFKNQNHLNVFL